MAYKLKFPTVAEVGKTLEYERFVAFGRNAYNQTGHNCYEIASRIADMFGYTSISRRDLSNKIYSVKSNWIWNDIPLPMDIVSPSPVCLVIRCPDLDISNDVHVTLEAYGREYNYGPGTREGFPIEMRIPMHKR